MLKSKLEDDEPPARSLYSMSPTWIRFLVVVSLLGHVGIFIVGIVRKWSLTQIMIETSPPNSDLDQTLDLFKSTLWTNVQQFWDSGAGAVSVVIILSGVVQPIVKTFVFMAAFWYPFKEADRGKIVAMQEWTSKFSLTTFYVEAVLLQTFAFTFKIATRDELIQAKIKVTVYDGLLCFLVSQLCAALTISLLRIAHRNALHIPLPEYSHLPSDDGSDVNHKKPRRRRLGLALVSITALLSFGYLYKYPCVKFTSSGLLEPFITSNGPVQKIAFDTIGWGIFENTHPLNFAIFFAFWFYVNLIFCPNVIALLGLISAVVPDDWLRVHELIAEASQLLNPWACHEPLLTALFFLAPNTDLISHWIFDDQDPCPSIEHKTHDEAECLVVTGILLAVGGFLVCLWTLCVMIVTRMLGYTTFEHHHKISAA